ncbi:MAG: hypothetical protein K6G33_06085 [Ruminococcus sp.]|uniref:hypothetical protein n=1 Tax=Ruminococcus sp. TaxID=41978 RepID=UPI0025F5376D|nr:hypothetical protein [Ruminococcus sp.]MCR5600291.1 hypothetical protein [Ruminococcus sp.]
MSNKLKEEMEKITMSDKTKESIIAACEEAARNRSIARNDNNEYADHVYGVEKVKPRNRIMRSISAVAACALLVGGLGTTGVLLHRQGAAPSAEVETTTVATKNVTAISPFGDFNTFEFNVAVGDGVKNTYDDETQAKLADFLNNFDWGDEISDDALEAAYDEKNDYSDCTIYHLSWKIDNKIYTLGLGDIGFAAYNVTELVDNGGKLLEQRAYKIDFEAFDKGMQEILKDELDTEETTVESPFTDIIKTAYLVDAFDASAREVTDEKIEALIKTYNSQTWIECDCADKFVDFDFTKLTRDYFVVVGSKTIGTNEYLMTTYDGYACVYTEIITDDGNNEKSEKKCYKCDDTEFGEKLLDVYDPIESDNVEPSTQDMTDYNNIVALLNGNDCGGLVVWCDENGGWCKQDFDQNQYDTVKNYFNEHEVKEMVPNVYGVIEAKRWNDVFGLSQIQLYDKVKKEHTILYISKDSSMIAISRPSEEPYGDTIRIYKAEGLEALQFIRNFAE